MPHESSFDLAFWECGHVEVDQGKTHPCDGRDVCSATYRRVMLADDVKGLLIALEEIATQTGWDGNWAADRAAEALRTAEAE